jgi:hypothetical protein
MMQDWEIKVRTGFPSLHVMMSFIIVATDGSIAAMTTTVSSLSWFEEWLLYFEWLWGRTATSFEALKLKYGKLD